LIDVYKLKLIEDLFNLARSECERCVIQLKTDESRSTADTSSEIGILKKELECIKQQLRDHQQEIRQLKATIANNIIDGVSF